MGPGGHEYSEKYAALLSLLRTEADFDVLATAAGYPAARAKHLKGLRRKLIEGYMLEVAADFQFLWTEVASGARVPDESVLLALRDGRQNLEHLYRHIRLKLFAERLGIASKVAKLRKAAGAIGPASFENFLVQMDLVRLHLVR